MQGDLFGQEGEALRERGAVMPALEGPVASARGVDGCLRLGTSSWSFPGWEGLVYEGAYRPEVLAKRGLEAYGAHDVFRTVGVDRGYYRPISRETLSELSAGVPTDFRFVVKAPVQLTGPWRRGGTRSANPDFLDPEAATALAVAPFLEGLGERAGVLLFQFPPMGIRSTHRGQHFLEHLEGFLRRLPRGPIYAVEVRDRLLWGDRFRGVLLESGAVPGFAIHPAAPTLEDQMLIAPPRGVPGHRREVAPPSGIRLRGGPGGVLSLPDAAGARPGTPGTPDATGPRRDP